MALCLRVPKVSELHGALRRELVCHVVSVPRHHSTIYGTKLVGEIESNVIPTASVRAWVCGPFGGCVSVFASEG